MGRSRTGPVKGLQNMVMQLRKICQHPFVFREAEDAMNLVPTSAAIRATALWNATIIRTAGKVALLDRMLPKLFATGHRVSAIDLSQQHGLKRIVRV